MEVKCLEHVRGGVRKIDVRGGVRGIDVRGDRCQV